MTDHLEGPYARSRRLLAALWLVALVACAAPRLAAAQDPPSGSADPSEAKQSFNVAIDAPDDLRRLLARGLSLVRWQTYPGVTPDILDRLATEARGEAASILATEGYFSPNVSTAVEDGGAIPSVRLRIDPGPPTRVTSVDIRLTGPVMESDPRGAARLAEVVAGWSLPEGARFRQGSWDDAKTAAVRTLARERYAAARIASSEALIDPDARSARLTVEVASGPPFRYGPIEVSGISRHGEELVRNSSPVDPGQPFSEEGLATFQRRLIETGYFASARVDIDADPAKADAAPVRVVVVEAKRRQFEGTVGISTDTQYYLHGTYRDLAVFGTDWRFRASLALDPKQQRLGTAFDSPPHSNGAWNTFAGRIERTDIENQVTEELALGVTHNWGWERVPSALIASAHLENQKVQGAEDDTVYALYLGYRGIYRDTDDALSPRRGLMASAELGGGVPGLSSQRFLRVAGRVTFFYPVSRADDLVLRTQLGAVAAPDRTGIPSTYLFRTGGNETVRGYDYQSLGVKEGDAVVGGRYLAIASAEYTHWFAENWGAAIFVDAGNAADSVKDLDPVLGVGVGARVRTPIGPVRVDVAYGEADRTWRMHLSLGFSF